MRLHALRVVCIAACLVPALAMAQEANWPTRPIKVIVPFGPGSAADGAGRAVAFSAGRPRTSRLAETP